MKKIVSFAIISILLSSMSLAGKIDPFFMAKMNTLSSASQVSAIVYMKEQADKRFLPENLQDKISALDEFSRTKQKDIQDYIKSVKKGNNVKFVNRFWSFNGFAITADKSIINEISKRPDVEKVEENSVVTIPPTPAVIKPFKIKTSTLATIEPNIEQINAPAVWLMQDSGGHNLNGYGVKVGIADTGILATHPDLAGKILYQATFDIYGSLESNTAIDDNGHGTHVAGIIAGGNASGKSIGVAPGVSLVIAKVFREGESTSIARVINGVQWLIGKNAKIINLSLGSENQGYADPAWESQVNIWDNLGIIVVSAIGNFGDADGSTTSPGNVPSAVGVGAVDSNDNICSFSSRGPVNWSGTDYYKPDICAPGNDINSSWNDGSYNVLSGTSMATPHISGTLALMLQANPTIESYSAKALIKSSATRVSGGTSWPNNVYGWGRVDAYQAVCASLVNDGTKPTIEAPQVTGGNFGEDLTVTSTIYSNITGTLPTAILYFRNDTTSWESLPMSQVSGGNNFAATIPASIVKTNVHYFIFAKNILDNRSVSPTDAPANYFTVTITPQQAIAVTDAITCPNPFSPGNTATFSYNLSKACDVRVRIYTMSGQCVKTFAPSGNFGNNTFTWDGVFEGGEIASNGVYLYQIIASDSSGATGTARGKIIVLR